MHFLSNLRNCGAAQAGERNEIKFGFITNGVDDAPVWMSQPWYPLLLDLCINFPLLFPLRKDLLSQGPQLHPLDNLQLAGWLLSTKVSERQAFLNNLGKSSWQPGGRTTLALMPQHGISGLASVLKESL